MAAAAAVTGSLLLTVGCSSSNSSSGIVTSRTFLGSVTRVGVQLSGDVAV